LAQVTDASAPNAASINRQTFDVLHPEIQKIKDLLEFCKDVQTVFCSTIQVRITTPAALTLVTLDKPHEHMA